MKRSVALVLAFLVPAAALAAEAEEHHGGAHGVPWAKLVFSAINLAIFLFIAPRLVQGLLGVNVREWLAARRRSVAEALAQADRARQEAEALRAEWQRRLDMLGTELASMLAQARADIAAERDQILAAARKAAEAIRRDAQRTAESEIRNAEEALRAEVAKLALGIAERVAPQRLTSADQHRFVDEFVQQVEQR